MKIKKMLINKIILTAIYLLGSIQLFAQVMIKGIVIDSETKESLPGASILIKGKNIGTRTNYEGKFALEYKNELPITLIVSYVGYSSQEQKITDTNEFIEFQLLPGIVFGEEIVITASREAEKIVDAPVTIARINANSIAESALPEPMVLLSTVKGVEYNRKGVGVIDFNLRGFNTSFNSRNLLLVNARNANLIASGLPLLPLTSFEKDDIEAIEVVLGPSSALYGFGASNGLINIMTKDPRKFEGTTIAVGGGTQSQLSGRFRHAQKLSEKFGIKITGSYYSGEDFNYTDSAYYDAIPGDGINPILGSGAVEEGIDPGFQYLKGEVGLYYGVNDKSDLILEYGNANGEFLQTTAIGRNQFSGWANEYLHLRYVSPRWFAQVSNSWNTTTNDDSRVLSVLTDNIESYRFFDQIPGVNITEEEAIQRGQTFRLLNILPDGTRIELPVNPKFEDTSKRFSTEVQYNQRWNSLRYIGGVQYQQDKGDSNGTYLLQPNTNSIDYNIIGAYSQLDYKFGNSGWKAVLAARGDHHSAFGLNIAPKVALLKIEKQGSWRFTYGRGIVAPTILQLELTFAGGNLLGNSNGFTILDIDYNTLETSERKIDPLGVEKLDAFELGYKGNLTDDLYIDANAFYNFHTDFITSATTEISNVNNGSFVIRRGDQPILNFQQPIFSTGIQLAGSALEPLIDAGVIPSDASASTQTYFNFGKLSTYGFDIGLQYKLNNNLAAGLNYSLFKFSFDENNLDNDINGDGKVEEFIDLQINSPEHKMNFSLNFNKEKFHAGLFGRWSSSFNYFAGNTVATETIQNLVYQGTPIVEGQPVAGSYNEGPLGGFITFDFNTSYKFNERYTASLNITNILDSKVRDFVTSPIIERLFYMELKMDLPGNKKNRSQN